MENLTKKVKKKIVLVISVNLMELFRKNKWKNLGKLGERQIEWKHMKKKEIELSKIQEVN